MILMIVLSKLFKKFNFLAVSRSIVWGLGKFGGCCQPSDFLVKHRWHQERPKKKKKLKKSVMRGVICHYTSSSRFTRRVVRGELWLSFVLCEAKLGNLCIGVDRHRPLLHG